MIKNDKRFNKQRFNKQNTIAWYLARLYIYHHTNKGCNTFGGSRTSRHPIHAITKSEVLLPLLYVLFIGWIYHHLFVLVVYWYIIKINRSFYTENTYKTVLVHFQKHNNIREKKVLYILNALFYNSA